MVNNAVAGLEGKIAIIGGSGVDEMPQFKDAEIKTFNTRFQEEADSTLAERVMSRWFNRLGPGVVEYQEADNVIFIKRHGFNKGYAPSKTQYIANLIAAKMLGAKIVFGTTAVGSLHEDRIRVEDLVIPHTYVDETQGRVINPFGSNVVIHANRWPAFSDELRNIVYEAAGKPGEIFPNIHKEGTYVVIPGDTFGTEGEHHKRKQYADIVGMTLFPEALAPLFDMLYVSAAFVVDLDKDANHEHGTRAVMEKLSEHDKVPLFMERAIPELKKYAGRLPARPTPVELTEKQLKGNIIPYSPNNIKNKYLRQIAREVVTRYVA